MTTLHRSALTSLAAAALLLAAPALAQVATGEAAPPVAPTATPAATTPAPAPAAVPAADAVEARLAALEKKSAEAAPAFPSVKLGGIVQADARHYLDTAESRLTDLYLIRRARLIADAAITPALSARIQVDVAGGVLQFLDGYADARWIPGVTLRVGKFTPPVGYERLISTASLPFAEYSQTSNLVPNRDVGLQASGSATRYVEWAIGIFDGVADGFNNDVDASDGKDGVARLALKPLDGMTIHLAGSYGNRAGTAAAPLLPTYRSEAQAVVYFKYNATAAAVGAQSRATAAVTWYLGGLGLLGEYVASRQRVVNTTTVAPAVVTVATPTNAAWQVAASWVITGEKNGEGTLKPARSLEQGGIGAFRVRARYQALDVDDVLFVGNVFAKASESATKASGFNVGLDWWPVTPFRFYLEYSQTDFKGGAAAGADKPSEKAVLTRFQAAF
jgi:phosphate-selective porin OprO/OprP